MYFFKSHLCKPFATARCLRNAGGFSLLELLIAMSILVILASVALPAYSSYQTRARVTEFTLSVGPYKALLSEWALSNSHATEWPASDTSLGWQSYTGDYVESVSYERATDASIAAIIVEGEIGAQELQVYYQGLLQEGRVSWSCAANQDTLQFLPKNCTSEIAEGL
ncbi:MAG: pilin [Gammaproteobacteria bacterium]